MTLALGTNSCSSCSRFGATSTFVLGHARDVAARSVKAGDEAEVALDRRWS